MKTRALLLIVLLAGATTANAEVYKWVDENGDVHFTDTPPPKQKIEEVKIQRAASPGPNMGDSTTASRSSFDENSADKAGDRELCAKAVRNLGRFSPVWERQIRAKFPSMSAEEKKSAQKALAELKADIRKAKSNMSLCTDDMKDATNRRNAECMADASDANEAMFCVM